MLIVKPDNSPPQLEIAPSAVTLPTPNPPPPTHNPECLVISIALFLHTISFNTVIFRKLYPFDTFLFFFLTFVQYSVNSSISKLHKK